MISDTNYIAEWLGSGRRPGNTRGIERLAFIEWYDTRSEGSGPAKYTVVKEYNKGPFLNRKEYLLFNKIMTFEVMEYEVE